MNSISSLTLKPIIDSRGGVHLTVYLERTRDIAGLKLQIHESIETARELLSANMSFEEFATFVAPLQKLLNDEPTLKSFRHNIGIFRKDNSFRMINLPIEVEHLTVVAESYHVKPLLKWMQNSKQFVWVDFRGRDCRIFAGDDSQVKLLDVFRYRPDGSDIKRDVDMTLLTESIVDFSRQRWGDQSIAAYLTGEPNVCQRSAAVLRRAGVTVKYLRHIVASDSQEKIVGKIRRHLTRRSLQRVANAIREFHVAGVFNSAEKSISQIAKFAIKGKVKKLIIADDCQMFGKFDPLTGSVSITPVQMDHRDDDILDDLAQEVISNGGEVIVTKQKWIPSNRPALAIVEADGATSVNQTIYDVFSRRAV
jgi:hypothetical protein